MSLTVLQQILELAFPFYAESRQKALSIVRNDHRVSPHFRLPLRA